jgi:hypothetical protein
MAPKFAFYEKVRIVSKNLDMRARYGDLGAILGRSQDESARWFYSVHVYRLSACIMFSEEELSPTGEFDQRSTFYGGDSLRVRTDETGEGQIQGDSTE